MNCSDKVTIAIPTRNRAGYLRLALNSALTQSHRNIEVVVSDNASSDDTQMLLAQYAADPRCRVLRQESFLSMVENWNACWRVATGEFFLLLSDDDLLEPQTIERMLAAQHAAAEPETIGVILCHTTFIDENGQELRAGRSPQSVLMTGEQAVLDCFRGASDMRPCSILMRRADMTPGYEAGVSLATDAAMWMRIALSRGHVLYVPDASAHYRMHQNLTAITSFEEWRAANAKLVDYATSLMQNGATPTAAIKRIHRAGRGFIDMASIGCLTHKTYDSYWSMLASFLARMRSMRSWAGFRECLANCLSVVLRGVGSHFGMRPKHNVRKRA